MTNRDECDFFTCNYSHENYSGEDICQYSGELCDIPYIGKCSYLSFEDSDICKVCQRLLYCGLKRVKGDRHDEP